MNIILVASFFFFFLTQTSFGQQTQEDTAALTGVVWRQGPWKVVVLCFGVPGTGPTPALAASPDGETAEALRRDWQGSLGAMLKIWVNQHRKCQSEVRCSTGNIPQEETRKSQYNFYMLCLGKEEITGSYKSINWSTIKCEFLE